MHKSSMLRMKWFLENYLHHFSGNDIKILDVGSYDVNGSYRDLCVSSGCTYTGLDMQPGPNVDLVLKSPYDWSDVETDAYDVVISGQAFEHIEFFWVIMEEMVRALKKNGLVCLIAPNGFVEHRYPVDCYRFFTDGMVALARYTSLEILHAHTNCGPGTELDEWCSETEADSMMVARKPYDGATKLPDLKSYQVKVADQEPLRGGLVAYSPPKRKRGKFLKRFMK